MTPHPRRSTPHQVRARKLADRIRVVVAETIEKRIKDPRLAFVTITDARVTNDLREATVFYTVLGSEAERSDTAAALESAKGILRTEVGRQTGVRFTPSLSFVADAVPANAKHIEDLLRQAAEADAEVRTTAADAEYAGGPDPYKTERTGVGAESDTSGSGEATSRAFGAGEDRTRL
jgi:ribosome-binding factor A